MIDTETVKFLGLVDFILKQSKYGILPISQAQEDQIGGIRVPLFYDDRKEVVPVDPIKPIHEKNRYETIDTHYYRLLTNDPYQKHRYWDQKYPEIHFYACQYIFHDLKEDSIDKRMILEIAVDDLVVSLCNGYWNVNFYE